MRGQDGVKIVQRIRQFVGEEIPAIIFTGDTSGEEIEAADLNKCSVLHKPQELNKLLDRIHRDSDLVKMSALGR